MANKHTKTNPNMNLMKKLYFSGMTQIEVAEEMGLTQKIVWRCLRDAGVKCRKAAKRNQYGINNNSWKGKDASYAAFHYRIYKLKGRPLYCEVCHTKDKSKHYDWASLSGKYDDPSDYKRMCRSCHWKYDKTHLNFKGGDAI